VVTRLQLTLSKVAARVKWIRACDGTRAFFHDIEHLQSSDMYTLYDIRFSYAMPQYLQPP